VWLRLIDRSGPFLSVPVLEDCFPQGFDKVESGIRTTARLAYKEWLDDPSLQREWIKHVLDEVLEYSASLEEKGAYSTNLTAQVDVHHEPLEPDFALIDPDGQPRLLVSTCPPEQDLQKPLPGSEWKASPATRMAELIRRVRPGGEKYPMLGLVTNGERWMLVSAPENEAAGFTTWHAEIFFAEGITLQAFVNLLGVRRFLNAPDEETLEGLLGRSLDNRHDITDQLGIQLREAIEVLVRSIDSLNQDSGGKLLEGYDEKRLHRVAITVMMRLVFLLYSEERELLPSADPFYEEFYAVSPMLDKLREQADKQGEEIFERRYEAWGRLMALFRAVHGGVEHERLHLMGYGGGLFDPDRFPFLEGRARGTSWRDTAAEPLAIDDRTVLHLLESICQLEGRGGQHEAVRLSFSELGVRQIGDVYESLLDHTAVLAKGPGLGLKGTRGDEPEVELEELEAAREKGTKQLAKLGKDRGGPGGSRVFEAIEAEEAPEDPSAWLRACGNDQELCERAQRFWPVVRDDKRDLPVVIAEGSVYVTAGTDRRSSGTHYTPESLTEPIVRRTLEPLVYEGPAEGKPEKEWKLKTAEELLDMKVCDPACGSGAFLVESCGYLSGRLLEAWEKELQKLPPDGLLGYDGKPAPADTKEAVPKDEEERRVVAQRLIVQRCLYGVDKNPLAVEMARLSLWLLTHARDKPFTFLDHAIRSGDSLVGLGKENIIGFNWETATQDEFGQDLIEEKIARADELRHEIRSADATKTYEELENLNRESREVMSEVRLLGDLAVAAFFKGAKAKERKEIRNSWRADAQNFLTGQGDGDELRGRVKELASGEHPLTPFHWEIEFPEVFGRENPGFDAMVGNPPFLGGMRISRVSGGSYRDWLLTLHEESHGNADLVAHFFRRAFCNLRACGIFGLIATNTISQGDTRTTGLRYICTNGGEIYAARSRVKWPGQAVVMVSVVHIKRGKWGGTYFLAGKEVPTITAFLFHGGGHDDPATLSANTGKSFQGCAIMGMGFTFDDTDNKGVTNPIVEMYRLIEKDPRNQEVIFPYIGGKEVNTSPKQDHHRYIINFFDRSLEECMRSWPELIEIVEQRVKPDRDRQKWKAMRERWWQYSRPRPGLFRAIEGLERVIVCCQTSKFRTFTFLQAKYVFDQKLVVFPTESTASFCALHSRVHETWALFFGSTMKDDPVYTSSDCFETYPFPGNWQADSALEKAGKKYYDFRADLMVRNNEGLTKTYNRFHDPDNNEPDIVKLRELHADMDKAVLAAYGWDGDAKISTDCDFHPDYVADEGKKAPLRYRWSDKTQNEVLARLLALNQERYQQEISEGLHEKKKPAKKKKEEKRKDQKEFDFGEDAGGDD